MVTSRARWGRESGGAVIFSVSWRCHDDSVVVDSDDIMRGVGLDGYMWGVGLGVMFRCLGGGWERWEKPHLLISENWQINIFNAKTGTKGKFLVIFNIMYKSNYSKKKSDSINFTLQNLKSLETNLDDFGKKNSSVNFPLQHIVMLTVQIYFNDLGKKLAHSDTYDMVRGGGKREFAVAVLA